MAHVELSLTDTAAVPRARRHDPVASLQRWASAAADTEEACLVLDSYTAVVAASHSCAVLLGFADPDAVRGNRLRDTMPPLLDFTAGQTRLEESEADRIPPLLAIASGLMARGLIRLPADYGGTVTLDAIATPLRDDNTVAGSLTFFARV